MSTKPSTSTKLSTLSKEEDAAASAFFADTPNAREEFIGWLLNAAQFSGKIADEIRSFQAAHARRHTPKPTLGLRLTR